MSKHTPESFVRLVEAGDFNAICDAFDALHNERTELLLVLHEAIGAVKTFHGPDCWDIYEQHSPEMKRWRAVISRATERDQA